MNLQDLLTATKIRSIDHHMSVEPSRSKKSRIQDFRPVRGCHDDHANIRVEPVHLCKKLVQGLFLLVMPAHGVNPSRLSEGIELVDKDDAGRLVLGLTKEVP